MKQRRLCSVEGCTGKAVTKVYCSKHYSRFLRYGDPHFLKTESK